MSPGEITASAHVTTEASAASGSPLQSHETQAMVPAAVISTEPPCSVSPGPSTLPRRMTPDVPTLVTSHVPTAAGVSAPHSTTSASPSVSPAVPLSSLPSSLLLLSPAPELELDPSALPVDVSPLVVEPESVLVGALVLVSAVTLPSESSTELDPSGVVASTLSSSSSSSSSSSAPVD